MSDVVHDGRKKSTQTVVALELDAVTDNRKVIESQLAKTLQTITSELQKLETAIKRLQRRLLGRVFLGPLDEARKDWNDLAAQLVEHFKSTDEPFVADAPLFRDTDALVASKIANDLLRSDAWYYVSLALTEPSYKDNPDIESRHQELRDRIADVESDIIFHRDELSKDIIRHRDGSDSDAVHHREQLGKSESDLKLWEEVEKLYADFAEGRLPV